ncbi:hypothetical protein N5P37_001284, partial [Trichoderma harzianum]
IGVAAITQRRRGGTPAVSSSSSEFWQTGVTLNIQALTRCVFLAFQCAIQALRRRRYLSKLSKAEIASFEDPAAEGREMRTQQGKSTQALRPQSASTTHLDTHDILRDT